MTDESLVTAWMAALAKGQSVVNVVEALSQPYAKVYRRVMLLQAAGVKLPPLQGQRAWSSARTKKLNQLNQLIRDLRRAS